MTFLSDSILRRYEKAPDQSGGGAMTIRRPMQGSEPGFKTFPSCACCYRPVADKRATYCSRDCRRAHHRLKGAS